MKLLDLYCGAGGAARGYAAAGFDVTGVDIAPQPRYPFTFVQADALDYAAAYGHEYDLIHASPVCKGYSTAGVLAADNRKTYSLDIPHVRDVLERTGRPYVIENVVGARRHLRAPVMLCGSMFGLKVYRHRLFETRPALLLTPYHAPHNDQTPPAGRGRSPRGFISITSGGITGVSVKERHAAFGYAEPVMTNTELNESIPPAFAEWVGRQMMQVLEGVQ